jgi:uncharacterized membrane protein YeaQ/YmgE (transglycosylase-associated protein family)
LYALKRGTSRLALIFWLLLGTGALIVYRGMRRYSGWAAFMEVIIGIIGAFIAESSIRLLPLSVLHSSAAQIFSAAAGALLLATAARRFVLRRE